MAENAARRVANGGTLRSYEKGLAALHAHPRIRHLAGQPQEGRQARPQLFQADAGLLIDGDALLQEEVFGPATVIVVKVRETLLHCAKALMRARLWEDDAKHAKRPLPTIGEMIHDQTSGKVAPENDGEMIRRYRKVLY